MEKINITENEFYLQKFMELQQANAKLYKILLDLYNIDEVKKIIDEKISDDFLDFVKKNLV